jgi:hypothetical protein
VPELTVDAEVEATFTKSEPFQATTALSAANNVTPVVGPGPTIFTDCEVEVPLTIRYDLLDAGAVIVKRLAGAPVQLIIVYCAEPVEPEPT